MNIMKVDTKKQYAIPGTLFLHFEQLLRTILNCLENNYIEEYHVKGGY
jgi:hypothetical protein